MHTVACNFREIFCSDTVSRFVYQNTYIFTFFDSQISQLNKSNQCAGEAVLFFAVCFYISVFLNGFNLYPPLLVRFGAGASALAPAPSL